METQKYFEEIRRLEPPSVEQICNYAEYISSAHSWYKHITITRPGLGCFFYFNPNTAMDERKTKDGMVYILREKRGCHYNMLPTQVYREKFGYLAYSTTAMPPLKSIRENKSFLDENALEIETPSLKILSWEGDWLLVPKNFLQSNRVFINALIHPFQNRSLWRSFRYETGLLGKYELDFSFLPTTIQHYLKGVDLKKAESTPNYWNIIFEAAETCHEQERNYQINNIVEVIKKATVQIYGAKIF